jgi:XTP/dITP diphosphohydrolase
MKIVLASGNRKKLAELQAILTNLDVELAPQTDFDLPEAIEDGLSFVENAIIKARHASILTGLPAIADDSGLEVDALGGAPGIYSARYSARQGYAPPNLDVDAANNALVLEQLRDVPKAKRTARFQCAIAMMRFPQDPMPLICQGTWEGFILTEACGTNGFGYDPLFYVPAHQCASAELSPQVKNAISHRGQALQQLVARWPFAANRDSR